MAKVLWGPSGVLVVCLDGEIYIQDTPSQAPIYFSPDEWRQIVEATRSVWEEPQTHPETHVTVTPNVPLGWHSLKGH